MKKPEPTPAEWEESLRTMLRVAQRKGWHGNVRVIVTDGVIRRVLIERSVTDPKELVVDPMAVVG